MPRHHRSLKSALLLALTAGALAACSSSDSQVDPSLAVAGAELNEAEGGVMPEALLPKVLPIPLDGAVPQSAEEVAAQVATSIQAAFSPAGCATAQADAAVVTYTLVGCTPAGGIGRALHPHHGRGNRHEVSATFTLTFSATDTGYSLAIAGTRVNGDNENLTVSGNATLDFDGTKRVLEVTTETTGTGHHGEAVTRNSHHVRSFDTVTGCYTLDGEWTTVTPDNQRTRSVSGFVQCGEACPASGTVIGDGRLGRHGGRGHHGGKGHGMHGHTGGDVTVTLGFDGTASAAWTSSDGESGTLTLDCQPGA